MAQGKKLPCTIKVYVKRPNFIKSTIEFRLSNLRSGLFGPLPMSEKLHIINKLMTSHAATLY